MLLYLFGAASDIVLPLTTVGAPKTSSFSLHDLWIIFSGLDHIIFFLPFFLGPARSNFLYWWQRGLLLSVFPILLPTNGLQNVIVDLQISFSSIAFMNKIHGVQLLEVNTSHSMEARYSSELPLPAGTSSLVQVHHHLMSSS